jgi:hypothetical protein
MMMSPNTLILLMPLLALLRSGARAEMGRRGIRHRVIIGHVQGDALVKRLRR